MVTPVLAPFGGRHRGLLVRVAVATLFEYLGQEEGAGIDARRGGRPFASRKRDR